MTVEELAGLRLKEAEELLERNGTEYSIEIIEPFFRAVPRPMEEGSFRIVRASEAEGRIRLTVCRVPEGFGPGPGKDGAL